MKRILLLLLCGSLGITGAMAQVQTYTQGNLTVVTTPTIVHDSTACRTTCTVLYSITVANASLNDTCRFIHFASATQSYLWNESVNTTGQNPWIINLSFEVQTYDDLIALYSNGTPNSEVFSNGTNKVETATDTITNISTQYSYTVTNPCIYSSITGKVYVDNNNDCVFDSGDAYVNNAVITCSQDYTPQLAGSLPSGFAYLSGFGQLNYLIRPLLSWLTSTTVSIYPTSLAFLFQPSTCALTSYTFTSLPQSNVDFPLHCKGSLDLLCAAGAPTDVRPGVPFMLHPFVSNSGCDTISGQLHLILDSNVTYDPLLSTNPANTVSGDTLTWNFDSLSNVSSNAYWNSFFASVYLTPATTVTIGNSLCFHVYTNKPATDIDTSNNDYTLCIPVLNSYDPNEKEVSPAGTGAAGNIPVTTSQLTYTIHFQNTGTAQAFNIKVVDTLDAAINPKSLSITGASNTMTPEWLAPNVVRFNFNNINLPDSNSNEPASHGFVRFNVALNDNLPVGTTIQNTASIYFDYNPAIVTNTTINTLSNTTGIGTQPKEDAGIAAYPNPATDVLNIAAAAFSNYGNMVVTITTVDGKQALVQQMNGGKGQINIAALSPGVYFIKAVCGQRTAMRRFVKQ